MQTETGGPLTDLIAIQRDLLVTVGKLDSPHGLGIKEQIERDYGTSEVQHSRLYPNLDELAEMGLVEKGSKDSRTNSYELTRRGRRELRAHYAWVGEAL